MDLNRFKGVVAASPTMFTKDGEIDKKATKELMEHYVKSKLNGVFLLSSTGEYFTMTEKKREAFVETAASSINGRIPLMAMVSDACLEVVKENIKKMSQKGMDALVLTAPYYYKYSQAELYSFFMEAAEASPVPILLYNQPGRLPSQLGEDLVIELGKHPNIIGIKDTCSDTVRMMKIMRFTRNRQDFLYYAGSESVAAYAAMLGANFVYALAVIAPKLILDIRQKGLEKNIEELLNLQHKVDILCGLFSAVRGGSKDSFTNFASSIKIPLEMMGIGEAYTSQFIEKANEKEYEKIASIINSIEEG